MTGTHNVHLLPSFGHMCCKCSLHHVVQVSGILDKMLSLRNTVNNFTLKYNSKLDLNVTFCNSGPSISTSSRSVGSSKSVSDFVEQAVMTNKYNNY